MSRTHPENTQRKQNVFSWPATASFVSHTINPIVLLPHFLSRLRKKIVISSPIIFGVSSRSFRFFIVFIISTMTSIVYGSDLYNAVNGTVRITSATVLIDNCTNYGTLEQTGGEIILSGAWENGGTFTQTGGTVTFQGTVNFSTFTGKTSFLNFRSTEPSKTLVFTAGSTQTVTGLCTINGSGSGDIVLMSLSSGNTWYFESPNSIQTLNYVDVTDAYASSNVIICQNSVDNGNYRWLFDSADPPVWLSPVSSTTTVAGHTLDTTPKFWCTTPARDDLNFTDAQFVFSTVSDFSSSVTTRTYTGDSTGWVGWAGGAIGDVETSTYTIQTGDVLSLDTTYYVRVRFHDDYFWSNWATDTRQVFVSSTNWTDTTISTGVTPIRADHFTELKDHITNVRLFRGLGSGSWDSSWSTLTAGSSPIKAVHMNDLRDNLETAVTNVGETSPTWTDDPTVAGTTRVRVTHITELREKALVP